MDYDKLNGALQSKLGIQEYMQNISRIADILATFDDSQFDTGTEESLADFVLTKFSELSRGAYIGNSTQEMSLFGSAVVITEEGPQVETRKCRFARGIEKQRIVSLTERLSILLQLKKELQQTPSLTLEKIPSGKQKQTMNDWLSDLSTKVKHNDSELIVNLIQEIFDISKRNRYADTKTKSIADTIPEQELLKLSCAQLCTKYGFDYGSGSIRKLISRLRKRAEEKIVTL